MPIEPAVRLEERICCTPAGIRHVSNMPFVGRINNMENAKSNMENANSQPFLSGMHLYLREVCINDVNQNYHRWINDPDVNQYLESRFAPCSIRQLEGYVRKFEDAVDILFLAIVLKKKHQHIGNIKMGPINWFHRFADIGVLIGERDCWGKGYASEAIALLTSHAFNTLNLHKLTAGCYATNKGSLKAFEKVGFAVEGIRKQHCFYKGKYVDGILLGLVNESWHNDDQKRNDAR